jgi:hypothetical protein
MKPVGDPFEEVGGAGADPASYGDGGPERSLDFLKKGVRKLGRSVADGFEPTHDTPYGRNDFSNRCDQIVGAAGDVFQLTYPLTHFEREPIDLLRCFPQTGQSANDRDGDGHHSNCYNYKAYFQE